MGGSYTNQILSLWLWL